MQLNDIVSNATVIITGTINDKMEMISGILENNMAVFNKFKNAVLMLNVIDDSGEKLLNNYIDLFDDICNINTYHLRDYVNLGWQFGTIIMERTAYDFVSKNLNTEVVLKLDFDIYLKDEILKLDISTGDIYFMPSVGYATADNNTNLLMEEFSSKKWDKIHPQSTIYLIKQQLDYLYVSQDWINKKYKEWVLNPIGNGPHHIGVACEPLLKECFERNNCKMESMISEKSFSKLLETIQSYRIVDPSAKNILFSEVEICHLYDDTKLIIEIN